MSVSLRLTRTLFTDVALRRVSPSCAGIFQRSVLHQPPTFSQHGLIEAPLVRKDFVLATDYEPDDDDLRAEAEAAFAWAKVQFRKFS